MQTTIRTVNYTLTQKEEAILEEKLTAPLRLLGDAGEIALLDIEVASAPAEGRSSTPCRVVANLTANNVVFHSEAVKPSIDSAADRVRSQLESEIRKSRGRTRRLWRTGSAKIKQMLHFGG